MSYREILDPDGSNVRIFVTVATSLPSVLMPSCSAARRLEALASRSFLASSRSAICSARVPLVSLGLACLLSVRRIAVCRTVVCRIAGVPLRNLLGSGPSGQHWNPPELQNVLHQSCGDVIGELRSLAGGLL